MMDLSVAGLRAAYAGGLTPEQLFAELDALIAETADLNAWIHVLSPEQRSPWLSALKAMEPATRPLWGVPFAIKDNIDLDGTVTTAGCPGFGYQPDGSAEVVARLIAAGAIPVGKTNLDQFATGLVGTRSPYGPIRNAIDPDWLAGGSSGGSAVAVAAGLVSFALGTDTAGSGRVPAAYHGLIGMKPTLGWWSTRGVVPASRTLDCVSVFTRCVSDAQIVAEVAGGFDAGDPYSRALPPCTLNTTDPHIGVFDTAALAPCEPDTIAAYERFVSGLDQTVRIDAEAFFEAAKLLYEGPWLAERVAAVGEFARHNPELVHPVTAQILGGDQGTAVSAFEGQYKLKALKRQVDECFKKVDVLALPTVPGAFTIRHEQSSPLDLNARLGTYTNFVNLLDLAAVAIPAGRLDGPIPFGITLIGPAGSDYGLLALAADLVGEHVSSRPVGVNNPGEFRLAVCGAHLAGQPLNDDLRARGAHLVHTGGSAPMYRLYALPDGKRPAMVRVAEGGASIEVEVWSLPEDAVGGFLATIAPPLGLGTIELQDGSTVNGFIAEAIATEGATDVTRFGGWRAWRKSLA